MASKLFRNEKLLIDACVAGREDEWKRFAAQYGGLIGATVRAATLRWMSGGREIEDIVAHVYEKLIEDECRRLRLWQQKSTFSTYLVQVVKHLTIDYLKKQVRYADRQVSAPLDDQRLDFIMNASLPEDFVGAEEAWRLRQAIEALPERQAIVMRLRLEGRSLRDVAEILGLPQGTVFSDSARAIEALRRTMHRDPDDGFGAGQQESM